MKQRAYTYLCGVIIAILALLNVQTTSAQELGTWQVYSSYGRATQCVAVEGNVYGLFEGALVRYYVGDSSVRTYDVLNDLSDINIVQIAYSKEAKRIILVYENGNIDLIDVVADQSPNKEGVFNISALKDKTIPGKTISSIYIKGVMAYIATGFGVVAVDMKEGVILDTYQVGLEARSVAVTDDTYYIITPKGLYSAAANSNLHLASSWTNINSATSLQNIIEFDGQLFLRTTNTLYRLSGSSLQNVVSLASPSVCLRTIADGSMVCIDKEAMYIFTDASTYKKARLGGAVILDVDNCRKEYFACEGDLGIKGYALDKDQLVNTLGSIRPNSPHRNMFSRMNYVQNAEGAWRLLVAGGDNTYTDTRYEPVAMYFEDGKWTLLDDSPASTLLPGVKQYNTTDVVQDPNDDKHFFVGTWRNGLKEYKNDKLIKIYNSDNSLIKSILPDVASYHQYESATATTYDGDGNLWFAQQQVDTIIRYISPDRKWHALYSADIAGKNFVNGYLFSNSGVVLMPIYCGLEEAGLYAFTHNGKRVTKSHYFTSLTNQDGTLYGRLECNALVQDMTDIVWLGTTAGLFVIENPVDALSSDFQFTQIKINRNDGSGFADYLLSGVDIRSLAVDGGNRKWVGTLNNGVYLISADGQEMLQHFDTSNSPLLSNRVNSIAVNPETGEVMFGTDCGLCSYMSDATEAEDKLSESEVIAYPNPVTPDHTGPIRIDGLTFNAEVKILSSAGQLVSSGTSNGGTYTWNGRNRSGHRVSSGVYHVVASTEKGKKAVVTRIVVVR